ncbi:hypothetical protein VKS41_001357 [Umbelopsis sp. WA50703]
MSDHIVFFIHGMGQQYEEFGNLKIHVATLQKNTEELLETYYPDSKVRVKFIPIEWHSVVHKLVDDRMDLATLGTVPKCNEAYAKHVEEFPDFISNNGQVHMMGCSLGGIAAYDILAHQWNDEDGKPPWEAVEEQAYVVKKPDINVPKLDFNVRFLFTCGSPVDFLYYRPPLRTKLFNVFHPFDPLGYRIEPMVNKTYVDVQPVRIHKLQRRRILPVPLPRIPNLGIKSSIAGAAPLIMRARRTFLRYMMTSEGTLIMDKNITERTVVDTAQPDADELQVQSADELPYDNSLVGKDDDDEVEETNSEGRKYDSAPEAEATPERPYMSRRISSRHKNMVRRRSHSVRDQDERIWIGADDSIGPRFVYESEEHARTTSWTATATGSDERPIWNRKWFKFDNLRRMDSGSTDASSKTLIPGEDKQGPGTDDETKSVGSTDKNSSKAASIINIAGTVATAALSAVGLKSEASNTQETTVNDADGNKVSQISLDTPQDTCNENLKKQETSLPMTSPLVPRLHNRALSADIIRVPVEYSSIVPNLEAIATSKSPVFEGANKTSYFYEALNPASPTDIRGTGSRDDDLNSESSYSTAIGLEVFSSPASLDRASICMTIPEDDLLDLDDAAVQTEEVHNQLGSSDSYAADADVDDSDDDTKVAKKDCASTVEIASDEEASLNTEENLIDGNDGKQYPRIDYVLNETVIDAYASEWIVAMKSHFKYWANRDLTFHMIKALIGDD